MLLSSKVFSSFPKHDEFKKESDLLVTAILRAEDRGLCRKMAVILGSVVKVTLIFFNLEHFFLAYNKGLLHHKRRPQVCQ